MREINRRTLLNSTSPYLNPNPPCSTYTHFSPSISSVVFKPNKMGAPSDQSHALSPSALQTLINAHKAPNNQDSHYQQLALQIAHNLRYQHNWTDVRIHYASTHREGDVPRPLISGLPPKRLYVHPDEQIELLQQQKAAGKTGLPDLKPEREWVLPCHLRERWTLRKFGEVFDAIAHVPDARSGGELFGSRRDYVHRGNGVADGDDGLINNKWRLEQPKRVLLATLDDDSTVVYYIVHDGIVKPRQN